MTFSNLKRNLICFKVVSFFSIIEGFLSLEKMVLVVMKLSAKQHNPLDLHESIILKTAFSHSPKWMDPDYG